MPYDKFNTFILIIALKRYKINSSVRKMPKYLLCKQFGLSVNTFSKYLKEAISLGFIEVDGDYYRVAPFKRVVSEIFSETGLYFSSHQILHKKSTNFYQIKEEIESLLVLDNIISRQEKAMRNKKRIRIDGIIKGRRTVKMEMEETLSSLLRDHVVPKKHYVVSENRAHNLQKYNQRAERSRNIDRVVTSARHTSKILGVSIQKANRILSQKSAFKRSIEVKWVNGCSHATYDNLALLYPNASIIPCPKIGMMKVCFGSSLSRLENPNLYCNNKN